MTARVTPPRPAPAPRARRSPALLAALLAAFGAHAAFADTPLPAHPPAPPLEATTPPPPDLSHDRAPATAESARPAPAPAARLATPPSAAATLGLPAAPAGPDAVPAATPAPDASPVPEPRVEHLVTEDDSVRIEEDRVRSQTTRIVVKSKIPGMGSYQIAPADYMREPSNDHQAGQRIWLRIGF